MAILTEIFGEGDNLNALQMSCRAVIIFIIAICCIRVAGRKTFGKTSAFDNTLIILLGALLSRAVAGTSPFFPIVCAGFTIALMTRLISWLVIKNKVFSHLVKGRHLSLYKDGRINYENLEKSLLSESDLLEAIRKNANLNSFESIQEICLEYSGELSVIKKDGADEK